MTTTREENGITGRILKTLILACLIALLIVLLVLFASHLLPVFSFQYIRLV